MATEQRDSPCVCVIGDTHGHLQLGLCMAARWQQALGCSFEAVLLCGDVGTFTSENQLDSTTRRHGKENPCELEFLHQWSADPQPVWISKIFDSRENQGLGLLCPVVMVHGNHEGFAHLETLIPPTRPAEPVRPSDLPTVDRGGYVHYLPSGWRCRTPSGIVVAGIGGIERGQQYADYHSMAFIDEEAVAGLLNCPPSDILLTHQGPSSLQGEKGSDILQLLLDAGLVRTWFHGHSVPDPAITRCGPGDCSIVVPLHDVAFSCKGPQGDDPGVDGWAIYHRGRRDVSRTRPDFWRDYRRRKWKEVQGRQLVSPDLSRWVTS